MLKGEDAWAEARFAESYWNDEDPECDECGGEINEDGDCMNCGKECLTADQKRIRNVEEKAEYLEQLRRDGE